MSFLSKKLENIQGCHLVNKVGNKPNNYLSEFTMSIGQRANVGHGHFRKHDGTKQAAQ